MLKDELINKQEAIKALFEVFAEYKPYFLGNYSLSRIPQQCRRAIIDIPSVEPTAKENLVVERDLISRQAILDLYDKLIHSEMGNGYIIFEGETYSTDIGYALDGVEIFLNAIKKLPSAEQTQMVDKSNFDLNQYKADLETAHDCGEAKWLKCIFDIKSDIENKITDGLDVGFDIKTEVFEIIDKHVNELRGKADESGD